MSLTAFGAPIQAICLLTTAAYLLSRTPLFRRLLVYGVSGTDRFRTFLFFALVVLAHVLISRPGSFNAHARLWSVNGSLVSAVTAGLLAGPEVGLSVGLWSWLVVAAAGGSGLVPPGASLVAARLINDGLGACIGGLAGGWVHLFRPAPRDLYLSGFVVGALSHAVWISVAQWMSGAPFLEDRGAWIAVFQATVPGLLWDGLVVLLFLVILEDLRVQQERVGSREITRAFDIANRTLPYLRRGLTEESAGQIARLVDVLAEVGAVALSDGRRLLAHTGAGADHHRPGESPLDNACRRAMAAREAVLLRSAKEIGCQHAGCPLSSGVVTPLFHGEAVIGCVALYGVSGQPVSEEVQHLAVGLAQFFSRYQLELADLERQTEAAASAELKALQSQVHPHFLFNVLNALAALCEIDPEQAGRLTVRLGAFLRRCLRAAPPPLIPLREEMENVRSYLEIEQVRFGERLRVEESIEAEDLDLPVPSFGLQILAENAVLHGLSRKRGMGTLRLSVRRDGSRAWVRVVDDGAGIKREQLATLFSPTPERASGLLVLRERARRVYGPGFRLRVASCEGKGTAVVMCLPVSE